ncbi:MAG: enoyl-CoA hydratase-related protein [Syntrophobacteraceae bacterium]
MKDQYIKPIPVVQPWTEAFWKATKNHSLVIQKCGGCGSLIFYPRKRCPECWSSELGWQESSGRGAVYTFAIVRDMVEPKFVSDLPYVLAMVELEESIRMMSRIVECDPGAVEIGMEVEVVFDDITDRHALPLFRPVDESLRIKATDGDQTGKASEPALFMSPDDYQTILYETGGTNGAVCRITFNRPEKRNSINRRMAMELRDAFRRVREDRSVGVVVLAGAGGSFCSGGDLDVFPSLAEHQTSLNWLAHEGLDVQKAITDCEKVVIAKIDGYCLAGGLELALCCDLLYAKESARMGFTEINMGILPGWGGTARIVRSMPVFRAREIIYSGRKDYTAREMFEMGLLSRVFSDQEFEEQFEKAVAQLAAKKPIALRMGKEIMAKSADGGSIDTALAIERNGIQWLTYAPDIQAMMDQFRKNVKS